MPRDRSRDARIAAIAQLIKERDLAALEGAAIVRDVTLSALARLESDVADARAALRQGTADLGQARACDRLAEFAMQRRAGLNVDLARATATWLAAREAAAHSTGRRDVLESLADASRAKSRMLRRKVD